MAVYNWRDGSCRRWGRAFDADTGAVVPFVFFWDSAVNYVGRFATVDGVVMMADAEDGPRPVEIYEMRRLRIEWADEADTPVVVQTGS